MFLHRVQAVQKFQPSVAPDWRDLFHAIRFHANDHVQQAAGQASERCEQTRVESSLPHAPGSLLRCSLVVRIHFAVFAVGRCLLHSRSAAQRLIQKHASQETLGRNHSRTVSRVSLARLWLGRVRQSCAQLSQRVKFCAAYRLESATSLNQMFRPSTSPLPLSQKSLCCSLSSGKPFHKEPAKKAGVSKLIALVSTPACSRATTAQELTGVAIIRARTRRAKEVAKIQLEEVVSNAHAVTSMATIAVNPWRHRIMAKS